MDFSFSPEQEDLRREARAFLEANPSPSMAQLAELGWVGILKSEDFNFLDAAVLFEELGRVLYDGPFVLNEVAAQPGDAPLPDPVRAAEEGAHRLHPRPVPSPGVGRQRRAVDLAAPRARQSVAARVITTATSSS